MANIRKQKHGQIQTDQSEIDKIEQRLRQQGLATGFESKVTEKQLAKIYRAPKTLEEIRGDDLLRSKAFEKKVSPYAFLKIAIIATTLFALVVLFIRSIEFLWFVGQLPGIALSFILMMLIPYFYLWFLKYIERIFSLKGKSIHVTLLIYLGAVLVLFVVSGVISSAFGLSWSYPFILSVIAAHFLITTLLLFKVLNSVKNQ